MGHGIIFAAHAESSFDGIFTDPDGTAERYPLTYTVSHPNCYVQPDRNTNFDVHPNPETDSDVYNYTNSDFSNTGR